jgi:hypothetical protein
MIKPEPGDRLRKLPEALFIAPPYSNHNIIYQLLKYIISQNIFKCINFG